MMSIALWNSIVTFSVIIPIIYWIVNRRNIKESTPIFIILVSAFLVEFISIIFWKVLKSPLANISAFYQSIEIIFFTYFVTNNIHEKYKKPSFIVAGVLIIFWISLYFFYKTPVNIIYGTCVLFEIILGSMYMLTHTSKILNNWKFTIVFAFFLYDILAIGVLSIADYIALHQQYLNTFFLIHSTFNLLLYLFILIGFIQCKKQSYKML